MFVTNGRFKGWPVNELESEAQGMMYELSLVVKLGKCVDGRQRMLKVALTR